MDVPNTETQEPTPCPACGDVHPECSEALLTSMEMSAYATVKDRLSPQGVETLGMVDAAVQELGVEAFDLAENVKALPADEIRTIEIYVARISLIEHARKELYEPGE